MASSRKPPRSTIGKLKASAQNFPEVSTQILCDRYDKLPKLLKTIMQLHALIYEPTSRINIASCLKHMGITGKNGKPYIVQDLSADFTQLLEVQLLQQSSSQGVACNPKMVEIVARDAVKSKQFESILDVIEIVVPVNKASWKPNLRQYPAIPNLSEKFGSAFIAVI
jgi:hypothetical protein